MAHSETYIDGVFFPSVTTILGSQSKPWLEKWHEKWQATAARGSLSERKTRLAGECGDAFHEGAERLSRGEVVEYPKNRRLGKMLERIEEFLTALTFVPKHTELKVVSRLYKYAGTLDAIGTTNAYKNELIIIDYKSSSAIYSDFLLQLAAYAQAYYEETGTKIKRGLIVHVSKDKPRHKLTIKEYKLNKRALKEFLKLRDMFDDVERKA